MNYTFIALVENKPGVLNRVASLLRRRNFNIESLAVGRTEDPDVSRMTIVVNCPKGEVDTHRIEANLYKLVNVTDVQDVTHQPSVARDLAFGRTGTVGRWSSAGTGWKSLTCRPLTALSVNHRSGHG